MGEAEDDGSEDGTEDERRCQRQGDPLAQ